MEILGIIGIIVLIAIVYVIGGLLGWGLKGIGEIFSFLVKAGAHALTLSYGSLRYSLHLQFWQDNPLMVKPISYERTI